jgi:hypothetical protein
MGAKRYAILVSGSASFKNRIVCVICRFVHIMLLCKWARIL